MSVPEKMFILLKWRLSSPDPDYSSRKSSSQVYELMRPLDNFLSELFAAQCPNPKR